MELKTIVKENTWLTRSFMDFGFGNGYVLLPTTHHLHGVPYEDIDVDIHGGLTFSTLVDKEMVDEWGLNGDDVGKWCVGFDTCHTGDTLEKWPKESVQEEANKLKQQLEQFSIE